MKVEEFYGRVKADAAFVAKSRVLVIRDRRDQKELRHLFEERPDRFAWVRLSKCVTAEAFVPPADQVFAQLRLAIAAANAEGKTAFVTGLSAMLALWDGVERASAFEQLRGLVDDGGLRLYAFVQDYGDEAQAAFAHPRYAEGRSVMVVGETPDTEGVPEIRLVSPEIASLVDGASRPSLSAYLNDFEIGGFGSQSVNVRMDASARTLAGVAGSVRQVFSAGDFLRVFCNYAGGLGQAAEAWLFAKMKDAGRRASAKDFAQNCFFQGNLVSVRRDAPRMVAECRGEEREVLVWMLRQTLPADGYLAQVLNDERFDAKLFKSAYVGKAAALIGRPNERALYAERREGIAAILQDGRISLDAEIAAFIEETKDVDAYQVLPWLTNRTRLEVLECVRRLRTADLRTLPRAFFDAFPLLEDYLAPYALGDAALEDYFTAYRALKVANAVTSVFCARAREIQYPVMGVKSRDDLLNDAARDDGAALLVVDAMGLEYLPMLLSLARRRGLDVANAVPAMARIPSSTAFNPIQWPEARRQNGIPDLDGIIHNGAHPHGVSTDEENFVAMLEVFDELVLPAVAQALATHGKVVLTADHGASRLAVLANQTGLARTLATKGVDDKAEDWRYLRVAPTAVPPPELAASVASNVAGDYWCVRGYDRFSKSGGKLNELHGGLTCEEVLVPFVVFEKGATFAPTTARVAPKEQFVENDDFDL